MEDIAFYVHNDNLNNIVHDDAMKWDPFRVNGPLCGEYTGLRRILITKGQ